MPKQSKKLLDETSNIILKVDALQVSFGSEKILQDVSFEIQKGELVAIVGPNGAGKTTLFKAILGLIPFQGKISFEGIPVLKALGKIAYVPQKFEFDRTFPLTVRELLEISSQNGIQAIESLCDELGVLDMLSQMIGELSGGQMQRVLIARAVLNNPSLILLDEPTSGIDQAGQKTFYDLVRHLNQEHEITILMISHELSMVYKHCSHVICLNRSLLCNQSIEDFSLDNMTEMYGDSFEISDHKHCHH